ncbi:MAG: hypothetical protein IH595_02860 [Bacteroidales bacterium]|nr:hypothetical protein [Bacteroidales bacterium]
MITTEGDTSERQIVAEILMRNFNPYYLIDIVIDSRIGDQCNDKESKFRP